MGQVEFATLRLFKALPIVHDEEPLNTVQMAVVNTKTIPKGYLISPSVARQFLFGTTAKTIEELYGLDTNQLNATFHKSFAKVRDASIERLVFEQLVHYMTTYGAQMLGVYDEASVYIPFEVLDVPEIDSDGFSFTVIRGMTDVQIKNELLSVLRSGVALSEQSVADATILAIYTQLNTDEVLSVNNREVRARLYETLGLVPSDPVEFLRYVTYRLTGSSLLIKNATSHHELSESANTHATILKSLFVQYEQANGLHRLGEVFLRFKPLFLALRNNYEMRPTINKIRRLSKTNHKPLTEDYLNTITSSIANGDIDVHRLVTALEGANIFRKTRLAHALATRSNPDLNSIVYKIRNGKSFATNFTPLGKDEASMCRVAKQLVLLSIANNLSDVVGGKKVFIPEGVVYGLPATEKQFSGIFPSGSYIEAPEGQGLVFGVHWTNTPNNSVDLDLSLISTEGKLGWDGGYREENGSVLFSGDLTNAPAPKGATELFWIGPNANGSWLVNLNHFNFHSTSGEPIPYEIVVGFDPIGVDKDHTIDPNNVMANNPMVLVDQQIIMGLAVSNSNTGVRRFYFSSSNSGGGRTAGRTTHSELARQFMIESFKTSPTLKEVLSLAGAELVLSSEEADTGYDLSPSMIDKTTILSLLSGK